MASCPNGVAPSFFGIVTMTENIGCYSPMQKFKYAI
jgi:hypothetical protein